MSYLAFTTPKKIINNAVYKKKYEEINKLKFYLGRAHKSQDKKSSTLERSLEYIYGQLALELEKIYNNITFDYSLEKTPSGASKTRNIIKICIEIIIDLIPLINNSKVSEVNFIKDLVLELEGGGKYIWIKSEKGELVNSVTFDAIQHRDKLMNFLSKKGTQSLSDNLYFVLKEKYNTSYAFLDKLDLVSKTASDIYKEDRFNLIKNDISQVKFLNTSNQNPINHISSKESIGINPYMENIDSEESIVKSQKDNSIQRNILSNTSLPDKTSNSKDKNEEFIEWLDKLELVFLSIVLVCFFISISKMLSLDLNNY